MKKTTSISSPTTSSSRRFALPTLALTCLAAWFSFGAVPAPIDESAPRALIRKAVGEVVSALQDDTLGNEAKRAMVQSVVGRETDIQTISALVLARNFRKFSDAQKEAFSEHFRTHLVLTYWKNAAHVLFERIDVTSDKEESRGDWSVVTKIISPAGGHVLIEYRLRKNSAGQWKIIDIIIEGISMVSNFRSQFQEVLSNGTPDKLLNLLRDKNAASERALAAEATPAPAATTPAAPAPTAPAAPTEG